MISSPPTLPSDERSAVAGPGLPDEDRLHKLHMWRLAIAAIGAFLLLLFAEPATSRYTFLVLLGASVLNLVYTRVAHTVSNPRLFAGIEIALDGVLLTVLVYLTGGVYSFAAVLYFGAVLAASLSVSERAGLLFASGATIALAAVQILYHLADSELIRLPLVPPGVLVVHQLRLGRDAAYLLAQGLALHTVALLGIWLTREVRHVRILYGEILEQMAEGLVAIDAQGALVFLNQEARRLLGARDDGWQPRRLLSEVLSGKGDRDVLACLLAPRPSTLEVDLETDEGRRAVQIKTTILTTDRGQRRGTIAVLTDLTLRRRAEEAERRAARLEQLEAVSLGIAHEVRNPLASIRGCVQELARLEYLGDDERLLADIVCRESDRLDGIVTDFLSFARPRRLAAARCDLAAIVGEIATLLGVRPDAAAVRIRAEMPPSFPIIADADLLKQVFLNVGLNALEAMERTGGELRMELRPSRLTRRTTTVEGTGRRLDEVPAVDVRFADTGPGIPPDELRQVLVPFFTTKARGSGLGLPLAERLIKAHEGELLIESEVGKGTTVTMRLPVALDRTREESPAAQEAESGRG